MSLGEVLISWLRADHAHLQVHVGAVRTGKFARPLKPPPRLAGRRKGHVREAPGTTAEARAAARVAAALEEPREVQHPRLERLLLEGQAQHTRQTFFRSRSAASTGGSKRR